MNLHDIDVSRPTVEMTPGARPGLSEWFREWENTYRGLGGTEGPPYSFVAHPAAETHTLRAEDLRRAREAIWGGNRAPEQFWPVPNREQTYRWAVEGTFDGPTFERQGAPRDVAHIVNEVYQLLRGLDRANIRGETRERVTFSVSPREYSELSAAYTHNSPNNAIHVDYGTGTMRVMGIRVVATG